MNQKYKDCCAKPNIFILKSGPNPKKLWLDWCWQVGSDKERLKGRIGSGSGDANGQSRPNQQKRDEGKPQELYPVIRFAIHFS